MNLEHIQKDLDQIKQRNQRVETDKAWEVSWVRIGSVAVITYGVGLFVMRALDFFQKKFELRPKNTAKFYIQRN